MTKSNVTPFGGVSREIRAEWRRGVAEGHSEYIDRARSTLMTCRGASETMTASLEAFEKVVTAMCEKHGPIAIHLLRARFADSPERREDSIRIFEGAARVVSGGLAFVAEARSLGFPETAKAVAIATHDVLACWRRGVVLLAQFGVVVTAPPDVIN